MFNEILYGVLNQEILKWSRRGVLLDKYTRDLKQQVKEACLSTECIGIVVGPAKTWGVKSVFISGDAAEMPLSALHNIYWALEYLGVEFTCVRRFRTGRQQRLNDRYFMNGGFRA